jgi:hypothetical protein
LPLFTGTSSETCRKVPDRVQIDTTRNRQNGIQNHAISGSHPGLNRTAVTCDASDLLEPRADGTLSLFGSSSRLGVYGSDQLILWKPPFHILKMCVWIGGEYRWASRKWSFTSQIFQWPASLSSLQWIEGPVAYAGREADPFGGLKKPY